MHSTVLRGLALSFSVYAAVAVGTTSGTIDAIDQGNFPTIYLHIRPPFSRKRSSNYSSTHSRRHRPRTNRPLKPPQSKSPLNPAPSPPPPRLSPQQTPNHPHRANLRIPHRHRRPHLHRKHNSRRPTLPLRPRLRQLRHLGAHHDLPMPGR